MGVGLSSYRVGPYPSPMKLYITLDGCNKFSSAIIIPCGSYKFFYDPETNKHILDGQPLTPARFNEAFAEMARTWPESQYRPIPLVIQGEPVAILKPAVKREPVPA